MNAGGGGGQKRLQARGGGGGRGWRDRENEERPKGIEVLREYW